jgi:hypothetical protein
MCATWLATVGFSGASVSAGDAATAYRAIAELAAAWTRQGSSPGAKVLCSWP